MNVFSFVSLAAFLLCFFLGNFIYHKNPKNQLNIMIAILSILVGFLAFVEFQYRQTTDFETAYLWLRVSGLWPFVPAILLHIALIFTGKNKILANKLTYILIYIPAIVISYFAIDTNLILVGIVREYWGWTYIFPENSTLFMIMSGWTLLCFFIAGGVCLMYYLNTKNIPKLQAKYLMVGLYFPLLISMVSDLLLPTMSIRVPETTIVMSSVGIGLISYGVWKYRFPILTAAVAADEIVSTMSNFLIMLDSDRIIVNINDATTNLLGFDKLELIGQNINLLFADREETRQKLFETDSNSIINCETKLNTKNNRAIPVLISKSVIKNENGNVIGIVWIGNNIEEIKETQEKIKESLEEKELLLRELHHRVKNNLQIISSLINLQSKNIKDKDDLEIFRESQSRVKSMAIIHENLYNSKDFANIEFKPYIRSLIGYLFTYYSSDSVEVEIDVDDGIVLNLDTSVPCGLIINELVTNSIKHAFKGLKSGKIRIALHSNDGCYTLIVEDNGIGIPEGTSIERSEKLGLQLVMSLVEQLEGKFEFEGSDGAMFKIMFRELVYKDRL